MIEVTASGGMYNPFLKSNTDEKKGENIYQYCCVTFS